MINKDEFKIAVNLIMNSHNKKYSDTINAINALRKTLAINCPDASFIFDAVNMLNIENMLYRANSKCPNFNKIIKLTTFIEKHRKNKVKIISGKNHERPPAAKRYQDHVSIGTLPGPVHVWAVVV